MPRAPVPQSARGANPPENYQLDLGERLARDWLGGGDRRSLMPAGQEVLMRRREVIAGLLRAHGRLLRGLKSRRRPLAWGFSRARH